jgi:hypothetical protein
VRLAGHEDGQAGRADAGGGLAQVPPHPPPAGDGGEGGPQRRAGERAVELDPLQEQPVVRVAVLAGVDDVALGLGGDPRGHVGDDAPLVRAAQGEDGATGCLHVGAR